MPDTQPDPGGPPRALLLAAVGLTVAVVGAILAIAAARQVMPPIAVADVPAPQATGPACQALLAALPAQLGQYRRAPIAPPAPDAVAAWRAGRDSEPVIMRCGLQRPAEFVVGSPLQAVDRVQWFEVAAVSGGEGRSTWYTADRPVYVALTLPSGSGPTPIQQLSEVIDRTLTATPIDPAHPGERVP